MGALRRVAPIPVACPFSKRSREAAPAVCGAVARASSTGTGRAGVNQKLSVPCPKYTKVVRNGVVVEMEVIPVVGGGEVPPDGRPFVKPPRVVETATCGTMVREKKSARRAGAEKQFPLPSPKRTKVTRAGVETTSVEPALGTLRKRMAAELDALQALLRKAELLSSGNKGRSMAAAEPRSEAPAEASIKTPPAKRTKVCTPAKIVVEFESAEDKNEFVDICGGVSPAVPVEKAGESGNSPTSSSDSGSSSSSDSDSDSDSGSSSSSDSDSDSESDSDPDETVDVPVPQAVLPQENETSVQPAPEPASEVVQSTEAEKHSKADLIAKAKIRLQLLEMERTVLPDQSIQSRHLKDLCIAEYGRSSIMQRLGLFLKADA